LPLILDDSSGSSLKKGNRENNSGGLKPRLRFHRDTGPEKEWFGGQKSKVGKDPTSLGENLEEIRTASWVVGNRKERNLLELKGLIFLMNSPGRSP